MSPYSIHPANPVLFVSHQVNSLHARLTDDTIQANRM